MDCAHAWEYSSAIVAGGGLSDHLLDLPAGCSRPTILRCSRCDVFRAVRCSTSRASKCKGCAKRYRGRVASVARSGRRFSRDGLFVTLTAPGDRAHYRDGAPCSCTPEGGTDLAGWNGTSSERWRRMTQWLRRTYGSDVEYFRATEPQKRGALHFHVILRRRGGGPLFIRVEDVRAAAMRFGFGHEVDVQDLANVRARRRRGQAEGAPVGDVFGYVAKYVSKSADVRARIPWRGRRLVTVGTADPGSLFERVVREWVDSTDPTYRTWVASRRWGDSMRAVRDAQAHHAFVVARLGADLDVLLDDAPFRPDIADAVGDHPIPFWELLTPA